MKSYKLFFVYGYNPYVITTRDDSLASAIKNNINRKGTVLNTVPFLFNVIMCIYAVRFHI